MIETIMMYLFAATTAVFAALYLGALRQSDENLGKFLREVMRHARTQDEMRKLKADLYRAAGTYEKPVAKFVPCEAEREVQG